MDALSPSPLNQGSLCNPGTTATDAGASKIGKFRELLDNGYIFKPMALEVQGSFGESSEIFITRLCKMLCRSHDDQRAGSFLKQRISMALQIGKVACVLGTVSDRCVRRVRDISSQAIWATKVSTKWVDQIDQLTFFEYKLYGPCASKPER